MLCQLILTFSHAISLTVVSDYVDEPCFQKTQCISLFSLYFVGYISAFRVAKMMMVLKDCKVKAATYTKLFSKPSDLHLALHSQESVYPF